MTFEQYISSKCLEKAKIELIKEAIMIDFTLSNQQRAELINFIDNIAQLKDFFDALTMGY